jgi:hypothetical protein
VSGKQSGQLSVDFETAASERPEKNGYNFVVLATFWQAHHEKESVIVTDKLGKQYGSLLQHSSLMFIRKSVVLTISSNSRNHIICGIGINLGFVPPNLLPAAINIANWKYTLTERIPRSHCFPLKLPEVFPSARVNVQLIGDGEAMAIDDIDVFVIDAAGFEHLPGTRIDWSFDARSLAEFTDDENSGKCPSELKFILTLLSAAPIRRGTKDNKAGSYDNFLNELTRPDARWDSEAW